MCECISGLILGLQFAYSCGKLQFSIPTRATDLGPSLEFGEGSIFPAARRLQFLHTLKLLYLDVSHACQKI